MECNSVLIVDDEGTRTTFGLLCRGWGLQVFSADCGKTASTIAAHEPLNLALVDLMLPDTSGLELITSLKSQSNELRTVLVTGYGSTEHALEAGRRGVDAFLEKPVFEEELHRVVETAFGKLSARAQPRGRLSESVNASAASRWARIVAVVISAAADPHNLNDWARVARLPTRTIERRCGAVGIATKSSLDFARLLRSVCLSLEMSCQAELLLDADPRTVRRLARLGLTDSTAPRSLETFLRAQSLVTNQSLQQAILDLVQDLTIARR